MARTKLLFTAIALLVSLTVADVEFKSATLSAPRAGFSAIEAGSKVYFIGGFEYGDQRATSTIEVYDLVAQNMSSPLQLNTSRAFITPVVIEPNIYMIGGIYYTTPAFVYDAQQRQFINYGNGPTVVNSLKSALFGSLLARIGDNGVDILDAQQGRWIDTTPLRKLLTDMALCAIFSEEGVVIVLGGVNVTTGVYSSSAWVYDMSSGDMHEYANIVPEQFLAANAIQSFGSNGVVAIDIGSAVLLHHLGRRTWRSVTFSPLLEVVSLPDLTILRNMSSLATFNWSDTTDQLVYEIAYNTDLQHVFVVNNTAVYVILQLGQMVFYIYHVDLQMWVAMPTSAPTFTGVRISVNLDSGWHIFATTSNLVYGYNPTLVKLYQVQDVTFTGGVKALISAEEADQVYIIENGQVTKTQFSATGATSLIQQQPCAIVPVARIGSDFLDLQGRVTSVNNLTQVIDFAFPTHEFINNGEQFVIVINNHRDSAMMNYKQVDIYNYVTNEWADSIDLPMELTGTVVVNWFYSAAALDNKLVVWMYNAMAVYDPITSNWTTYTNYTQSPINNDKTAIHIPVPTAQGSAFMRTDNNTMDVFSPSLLPAWNSTSPAPEVEDTITYKFQQCLVHNDSQLFITSIAVSQTGISYNTLYIYNVHSGTWEYQQLPNALTAISIIALAGDYLLSMNNGILSYWDLINRNWYDQVLDFRLSSPAIALETSANVTFIAGGINSFNTYSNALMVIPHSAITINAPISNGAAPTDQLAPSSGLSEGELIVVIVVPVAVVLIAGALLVFFLVRRNKRRRRQGSSSTIIGLAGKYGQWFIPFESIRFGDQLGQGASGQVFKGTWNSTTVALKVSMTQANSTVIGELELMMQLRPHPNVIQLFGFSVHPETDSIILVIEYCSGGSLDDALFDTKRSLSVQQKLSWLIGMAKGLEHLHANNIVHRDIAARNVLLHQNEPKITDFGMSRLMDSDKQRGTTKSELGPIRWMAPESLKSKEYSNKSDIWSFGVLMFEVIAQSEPHIDADPIEIGRLIRDNGLTPTIPSSCPSELAQLMKECWHMSPDKRISIDEIVLQLEAIKN